MSKHTPGPWRVSDEEDGTYVRADAAWPDDWHICRVSDNNGAILGNARLIAAAPDLLAALRRLVTDAGREHLREALVQAYAAIAKAEGK